MQYTFSALDIAFFTLLYESALPKVVMDPLGRSSEKRVARLQEEFYARQEKAGLLTRNGDNVVLDKNLAMVLAPIFEGSMGIMHSSAPLIHNTPYDLIFYVSDIHGVTCLKTVHYAYSLKYYSSVEACFGDFQQAFKLQDIGPYLGEPFKICVEGLEMNELFERIDNHDRKYIDAFAQKHGMEIERLQEIVKSVRSNKKAVQIEVARRERIKLGGIMTKIVLQDLYMLRFIASPDGDLFCLESVTDDIWQQATNFEGR